MRLHQKSSKKLLIIILLVALLIGGGVIGFLWINDNDMSDDNKSTKATETSIDKASKEAPSSTESSFSDPTSHEQEKDITPAYEGESVDDAQTLSGAINYKSVVGNELVIRTTINQMLGTGTCSLTLTRTSDQKTVSKTAAIMQNPSSSTCQGFNIPSSELGSGNWNISVKVTSGDRTVTLKGAVSL